MEFDVFIDDYLGTFEDIQGNVNVAGLVYENEVDEEIGVFHDVYLVWIEQVEDGLAVSDSFDAYHWTAVSEQLFTYDLVGNIPVEVYHSSVNVIHDRKAAPVRIWWVGLNVVHGPDTFYEEIYSNLHIRSPFVQGVPYYWEHVYESFDAKFDSIQPHPGIHVALYINTGDLINFRHTVNQQYYFNSQSYDRVGTFARVLVGYGKHVSSEAAFQDHASRIIGAPVDEHFTLVDAQFFLESFHVVEKMFLGDAPTYIREFLEATEDFYGMSDEAVDKFWMIHSILESLDVSPACVGTAARPMRVDEKLGVVTALAVLQASQAVAYDAIEVDLSTGSAHLVRDGADSGLGFGDEVTHG